jgi:hypothetical protein
MAKCAHHCHTWLLSQLLDTPGASRIDTQNSQDSDYINALSFYCGSHDVCLDPVKIIFGRTG